MFGCWGMTTGLVHVHDSFKQRFFLHQISLRHTCFEVLSQILPDSGTDDGEVWPNLHAPILRLCFLECSRKQIISESVQTSERSDPNNRTNKFLRVLLNKI